MNKKTLKSLSSSSLLFSLFFVVLFVLFRCLFEATTLFAAPAPLTYELLAELPGISDTPTHVNYLSGAIKLIIGVSTALAVLVIVYAGVVGYIGGATNPASRSAAKERIQGALLGLTLILISYIILNTINPDLLSLDLTLCNFSDCSCPDPCAGMPGSPGCPNPCVSFCTSHGIWPCP